MGVLFGSVGMFGVLVCFVLIILEGIKRKPVKKIALSLLAFFVMFIVGSVIASNEKKEDTANQTPSMTVDLTEAQTEMNTEESIEATEEVKTEAVQEDKTSSDEVGDNEDSLSSDNKLSFILGEEIGEYGKEVTLNAGTEFEENEIMFYIPAGSYTVTNNSSAAAQLTVYSGGPEKDGEWETFVDDGTCPKPVVIMGGEKGDFEIGEGQFLVLSDGSENILFEMK